MDNKKAIVLLSGGLDSTTTLFWAINEGYDVSALIFDYGQRHVKEIESAKKIAILKNIPYQIVPLSFPWNKSSLVDKTKDIPVNENIGKEIPSTYVASRNIIFLSIASSFAENVGAQYIFIGANSVDYSGYPDCRPEFIDAMQHAINKGTKQSVEGKPFHIIAPLLKLSKAEIIKLGNKLDVPFEMTWSCYKGGDKPCGVCDSCKLRAQGFREVGIDEK